VQCFDTLIGLKVPQLDGEIGRAGSYKGVKICSKIGDEWSMERRTNERKHTQKISCMIEIEILHGIGVSFEGSFELTTFIVPDFDGCICKA
jgi:hypothetical protein